jgi:hypothetical protein
VQYDSLLLLTQDGFFRWQKELSLNAGTDTDRYPKMSLKSAPLIPMLQGTPMPSLPWLQTWLD